MKTFLKLVLFNLVVGILILGIGYVQAFGAGFGADSNILKQEERFFILSVIAHLIINLVFIYSILN